LIHSAWVKTMYAPQLAACVDVEGKRMKIDEKRMIPMTPEQVLIHIEEHDVDLLRDQNEAVRTDNKIIKLLLDNVATVNKGTGEYTPNLNIIKMYKSMQDGKSRKIAGMKALK